MSKTYYNSVKKIIKNKDLPDLPAYKDIDWFEQNPVPVFEAPSELQYLGQYIGKEEDKDTPEQVKALLALEEVYKRVTRNVKKGATTPKAPAQIQAGEDIAGMVAQAVNKEKEKK